LETKIIVSQTQEKTGNISQKLLSHTGGHKHVLTTVKIPLPMAWDIKNLPGNWSWQS